VAGMRNVSIILFSALKGKIPPTRSKDKGEYKMKMTLKNRM
jgi:hypothetical protein